jgi:Dedicator of cytokinesis.
MFETPFTKDGSNKPRAEPCDQWKRRTIITTEYSFPYVKKRLKVVSKREIELSPIEVRTDFDIPQTIFLVEFTSTSHLSFFQETFTAFVLEKCGLFVFGLFSSH